MKRIGSTLGVLAIAGAALAGGMVLGDRRDGATTSASSDGATLVAKTTAKVQQKDLVIYDETTANLVYTGSVTVQSPVAGTVTSTLVTGQPIVAGTVVATIDGEPVVAMIGDVPGYRDLSTSSSDGVDVRQLEQNLVALGFDPDGNIAIDEEYDGDTADAVDRWQASLGLDEDGKVPESRVTFIPGNLTVDSVTVEVGAAVNQGTGLLSGRQTQRRFEIAATIDDGGTVDRFAPVGIKVETGTVLFWQNGIPVTAIVGDFADVPTLQRDLSTDSDDGSDIRLLERMLVDAGYDPDGGVTVDDHFDDATAVAVFRWWGAITDTADVKAGSNNLGADGLLVDEGSYVVVPSGLLVGNSIVEAGTTITSDANVLVLTSPARVVTTSAPIGDQTFTLNGTVDVEFPDGTIESGTITSVGTVASNSSGTPGDTPTVDIQIEVAQIPESVNGFVQIPVTLRVVSSEARATLAVPATSLVALAEGGYAIEVVTGKAADGSDTTELRLVEPGLFADGFVAVTSESLTAGETIVVPS